MIRNERGWQIRNFELYPLLGIPRGHHLPIGGLPEREIQGQRVYVTPAKVHANGRKSSQHRVFVICSCGRHIPFGRMHQHMKGKRHG